MYIPVLYVLHGSVVVHVLRRCLSSKFLQEKMPNTLALIP